MKKYINLTTLLLLSLTFFGQQQIFKKLSGIILDKATGKPLQYATGYNVRAKNGTVTNHKGYFLLENTKINDTIIFSYIGYQNKYIICDETSEISINLTPKNEILNEVTVLADNGYLYDLISKIRKKYLFENAIQTANKNKTAKTYYQLETFYGKQRIELTEAYFNGIFSPYGIEELRLKKGRAGLKPIDNSLMINSETSKAFRNHSLFYRNVGFPENPFSLSKRKLKKKYKLTLVNAFKDSNHKFFVIQYQTRNSKNALFSGKVWIDTKTETIKRIELRRNASTTHPFLPYGNIDRIDKADLYIAKEFVTMNNKNYVSSIDFNYTLYCSYQKDSTKIYHTKTFIKAYDYKHEFNLPYFNFVKSTHQDIKDISASIYDSTFWNNAKEFAINVGNDEKTKFIEKNSLQIHNLPLKTINSESSIFEYMYRHWQSKRLQIGEIAPVNKKILQHVKEKAIFEYNIDASIYMDWNTSNGKTIIQLSTALDPKNTLVDRKMTNNIRAFINMYFDIVEIEKRILSKEIKNLQNTSIEECAKRYKKHNEILNIKLDGFSKDVFHGSNKDEMFKWNKYIYDILGVDNIAAFNLFQEELITN